VVRVPGYRSRGPGFDSPCYQIFWEIVGLERGPLSLVRIIEELLEWKSSSSGLENRKINGRGDPLRWPRDTLYPQKLALTSPTSGGRSVGIVRLRTKATEFSFFFSFTTPWRRIAERSIAPPFIISALDVSFTCLSNPGGRGSGTHCLEAGCVPDRFRRCAVEIKSLGFTGNQTQVVQPLSLSLYILSYPGSPLLMYHVF
jgi:hypothetical protein